MSSPSTTTITAATTSHKRKQEGGEEEKEKEKEVGSSSNSTERCAICLCDLESASMLDRCFHMFCFLCIMQWSQVNLQCPLCKADFISIIYDVKSESEYKRYYLRDQDTVKQNQTAKSTGSGGTSNRVDLVAEYNSRFGKRHKASQSDSPAVSMTNPNLPFSTAHSLRRAVYVRRLRAVPIQSTKTLHFTPSALSANESFWHSKLKPWLTRELQALLEEEDVDLLVVFILSMLSKKDVHSKEVKDQLAEWLFDYVDTFVHEFTCFAQSPYDMINYDKHVQYDYSQATSSKPLVNRDVKMPPSKQHASPDPSYQQAKERLNILDKEITIMKNELVHVSNQIQAHNQHLQKLLQ